MIYYEVKNVCIKQLFSYIRLYVHVQHESEETNVEPLKHKVIKYTQIGIGKCSVNIEFNIFLCIVLEMLLVYIRMVRS